MLKKRLIGVITVKDDWAVQSLGYNRYLPLGRPEYLAENLDRWEVDEILIMSMDRSIAQKGPDLNLLKRINSLGLSTPLSYGGGIQTSEHAIAVIQAGAERVCIDAIIHNNNAEAVDAIAYKIGTQALIATLPLTIEGDTLLWYNYLTKQRKPLEPSLAFLNLKSISEFLIIDYMHEGYSGQFDVNLIDYFPKKDISLISFGGINSAQQLNNLLAIKQLSAVAIGNFLNYKEHAVQHFKSALTDSSLRAPVYAVSN